MPSGTLTKKGHSVESEEKPRDEKQFMENFKITRPPYRGQTSYER